MKNILSDTDFTKPWDNRYGVTAVVARVCKIEVNEKGANVRVMMPDRLDHNDQPLISKPIPVMQIASKAKKSFAVPRIDDDVLVIKLPNGTSNYSVVGSFYTSKKPPPVTDPLLDYTEWEGGHKQTFDANEDADVFLKQEFKGGWDATIKKDVSLKTTDGAKFNIEADGDVLVKSATGNIDISSPTGTVKIEQQTIELTATTIKLTGHVVIVGAMDQSGGVHHDPNGFHTTGMERIEELEKRVARLERLVSQLTETQS